MQILHGRGPRTIDTKSKYDAIIDLYGLPDLSQIAAALQDPDSGLIESPGSPKKDVVQPLSSRSHLREWMETWCLSAGDAVVAPQMLEGTVAVEQAQNGIAYWFPRKLHALPEAYDDLYAQTVGKLCPKKGTEPEDPAICLVCGETLCAGSACCREGEMGACTQHVETCGGGVGMFLLLKKCQVVLVRGRWAAFYPSPYLDAHGEEDIGLRRGRPLMLKEHRYNTLKELWSNHMIAREVSRIRSQSERVIRQNYF